MRNKDPSDTEPTQLICARSCSEFKKKERNWHRHRCLAQGRRSSSVLKQFMCRQVIVGNKLRFQPLLGMNQTKMLSEEIWNSVTCYDSCFFRVFLILLSCQV